MCFHRIEIPLLVSEKAKFQHELDRIMVYFEKHQIKLIDAFDTIVTVQNRILMKDKLEAMLS